MLDASALCDTGRKECQECQHAHRGLRLKGAQAEMRPTVRTLCETETYFQPAAAYTLMKQQLFYTFSIFVKAAGYQECLPPRCKITCHS